MKFTTFLVIYLSIILSVSAFVLAYSRNETKVDVTKPAHFSVVWKGFQPSYGNQTEDYYICINNLKETTLRMNIALKIQNFENYSYWFMIDQYETPPTGWNIAPYYIGRINVDTATTFVYSNLTREKPSSIPEGKLTETVNLVVKAFWNDTYTNLYSQANFTVRCHFIDLTSTAWTVLYHYTFDDGTSQGWYGGNLGIEYYNRYRSWPCCLVSNWGVSTSINTNGPYTEAYIVLPMMTGTQLLCLDINGQRRYESDVNPGSTAWHQVTAPLPVGATTTVGTPGGCCLDEIYVVAK